MSLKVSGLNELIYSLEALGKKELRKASQKAVREIAKDTAKNYKALAPKRSGLLASQATALNTRSKEKGIVKARVIIKRIKKVSEKTFQKSKYTKQQKRLRFGTKKRFELVNYYAHFIEYGFLHKGRSKKGTGKRVQGQFVLKRASELTKPKINAIIQASLNESLQKAGLR